VERAEHGREARADALGARGEHGAPHRRVDRAAARVVLAEREEEERYLGEVVGQPLGRALDGEEAGRGRIVRVLVGGGHLALVEGAPQLVDAVLVERRQLLDQVAVVDEEEAPVLLVPPLGARIAASRILAWTPAGIGSGRTRRMALVVYNAS